MQPQDNQYSPSDQMQPTQPTEQSQPIPQQVFTPQQVSSVTTSSSPDYAAPDLSVPAPPTVDGSVSSHKGSLLQTSVKALAVLLVLGGLVGVGYGVNTKLSQDHARTVAANFISSLNAGNNVAAYKSTTSNLRSIQTEAQFSTNLGDLTAKTPVVSKRSLNVDGSNAVYTATVDGLPKTDFGRTDGVFTVALVKHGLNNWQVDGVQVQ